MIKLPKPGAGKDGKTDIHERVKALAASYVPEWKPFAAGDAGGALAELFCGMFDGIERRADIVPNKYHTELLSLVGVTSPSAVSAGGLVKFTSSRQTRSPVTIERGTEVFAVGEGSRSIIYSTERTIGVTSAKLETIYYTNNAKTGDNGIRPAGEIKKLDAAAPITFFAPTDGENITRHRFEIGGGSALRLGIPCELEVRIKTGSPQSDISSAALLADKARARWSYISSDGAHEFDSVRSEGAVILLTKSSGADIIEADERRSIFCDIFSDIGGVEAENVTLRPLPTSRITALTKSDSEYIDPADGGYAFGKRPSDGMNFYIRCDDAFSKRGSKAFCEIDVRTVVYADYDENVPQYNFGRSIIDKNDALQIKPDDVFIESVAWEYYNGIGWTKLEVAGDRNPFSCSEAKGLDPKSENGEKFKQFTFIVPKEAQPVIVGAEEGYFIRARITGMANYFSRTRRFLLPFVKSCSCSFDYPQAIPADYIRVENNGDIKEIKNAQGIAELGLSLYSDIETGEEAMYLRFDRSPHAMPLSLAFICDGVFGGCGRLFCDAYRDGKFNRVKISDRTAALSHSGELLIYLSEPLEENIIFGERGYWLRLSCASLVTPAPRVISATPNAVSARQYTETAPMLFSAGIYDAGRLLKLVYSPVSDCIVTVDEGEGPIKWMRCPDLMLESADARVYTLDCASATITFGDGIHGMVPPYKNDERNIKVRCFLGGGRAGNMPVGAVSALVTSIPKIVAVENITPMSGGTDEMTADKTEKYGGSILRHLGRAIGAFDYEQLILSQFCAVKGVKCFKNTAYDGSAACGEVTVALMPSIELDDSSAVILCRDIYDFIKDRCDGVTEASGRLHIRLAQEINVSVTAEIIPEDYDDTVRLSADITSALEKLINESWRTAEIGRQLRIAELNGALRSVRGVSGVGRIQIEGSCRENGVVRIFPIEDDSAFPLSSVRSGTHTIKII